MWNHFYTNSHRTTNSVESWHSRLNADISRSHPNIWHFLSILKEDQQYTSTKIELALTDQLNIYVRNSILTRESRYQKHRQDFLYGYTNLEDFMCRVSQFCPKSVLSSAANINTYI